MVGVDSAQKSNKISTHGFIQTATYQITGAITITWQFHYTHVVVNSLRPITNKVFLDTRYEETWNAAIIHQQNTMLENIWLLSDLKICLKRGGVWNREFIFNFFLQSNFFALMISSLVFGQQDLTYLFTLAVQFAPDIL